MNEALAAKLKYLHLGQLLAHWDDYLKLAGDQRFSHARLLTHVVEEQYRIKRERCANCGCERPTFRNPGSLRLFPSIGSPSSMPKKSWPSTTR